MIGALLPSGTSLGVTADFATLNAKILRRPEYEKIFIGVVKSEIR